MTDVRPLQDRLREDAAANEAIADDCPDEADRYVTARLEREAADYIDAMLAATGRRPATASPAAIPAAGEAQRGG